MNRKSQYNYSIIIPHKNIPHLLKRCLASIPRREDTQIIVVDDNSDPAIVDFENFPGSNDPYVEVYFTKEGKGAGYARNIGLSKAKGRLLLFADADDFFNYCIDDVLEEYKDTPNDIIYFKCNSVDSDKYTVSYRGSYSNSVISDFMLYEKGEKLLRYSIFPPWAKIINRNLVLRFDIKFDETSIANDVTFSYLCGFYAKSISVDNCALYCVTYRKGSLQKPLAKKHNNVERLVDLEVLWRQVSFLKRNRLNGLELLLEPYRVLLHEYIHCKDNYKKAKKNILELGFSKGDIFKALSIAFIWYYVLWLPRFIYRTMRSFISKITNKFFR